MRLEDVSEKAALATTPPDEAAKNVVAAQFFETPSDQFKNMSKDLMPKFEEATRFDFATPVVASVMRESEQDASAIKPALENLNYVERIWGSMAAQWKKRRPDAPMNQLNQLRFKKLMQPDSLTEDETFSLIDLEEQEASDFGTPDYGIQDFFEKIPSQIAGEISNISGIISRNQKVFSHGMTSGLTIGTLAGTVPNPAMPVTALFGAASGTAIGFATAYATASLWEAFKDTASQSYGAILNAKDDDGQPIKMDRDTARYLAMGTGVVSAALESVADVAILKKVPGLKKFFGGAAAADLAKEASKNTALKRAMSIIGSGVIEGGTETAQEMVQILSEELTGTFDQGAQEFRIENALKRFADRVDPTGVDYETQERLASSAVIGAALGSGFTGTIESAPKIVQGVKSAAKTLQAMGQSGGSTTVTGRADSKSMPVNDVVPMREKAVEGAAFEDSLSYSVAVLNEDAKLKNLPKEYKIKLMGKMLDNYLPEKQVWLSAKVREHIATNPEKLQRVQDVLDRNKLTPDAPIQISTHEFGELILEYPELSSFAQISADGMSANTARDFVEQEQAYQQKKREMQSMYDLGEKSPEERAYKVKARSSMTNQELAVALDSKETAAAYLDRLAVEESVVLEEVKASGKPVTVEQRAHLDEIANLRTRTSAMVENLPDHMTVQDLKQRAVNQEPEFEEISSLEDYVDRPTFTEALKSILPEAEVKAVEEASLAARKQTADAILDAAIYEMNSTIDLVTDIGLETQVEIEAEKVRNDPNLKIVDKFHENNPQINPTAKFRNVTDLTAGHVKKGYSPFAIDPSFLTDWQKKRYLDNPQLKKHKMFVKGGITPDESAQFLGVNGGNNLLALMSTTKTRNDVIAEMVAREAQSIRNQAIDAVDLDSTNIVKAANNRAKNHLSEAKFLKDERWPAFKKAIKRVAKALPSIDVLHQQASFVTSQTKVKDLAPKKFMIGERRAHNRAVDSVLKGDLEQGFDAKEQAALNALLTSETQKAVADVRRAKRFVKKLKEPKFVRMLKDADMLDAVHELTDIFNLDSSMKGNSKRGAYVKFLDRMIDQGVGNFSIPQSVSSRLGDPRITFGDMTVEEVRFVHIRLKQIFKMAELKNQLMLKHGNPAKGVKSFDATVRELIEDGQAHPDFDSDRAANKLTDKVERFRSKIDVVRSFWSSMKNIEHLVFQMDRHKFGGKWYQTIVAPLKGDGEYSNWGDAGKTRDWIALREHFETNVVDYFGKKEWRQMSMNYIKVEEPEFKHFNGNGTVSEASLFMMLLNDGNDSNAARLNNFGIPLDVIRKVYNKHLTEKHGVAAQRIFDMYKSYFPRVKEMHERMSGETVQMIEARPFSVAGKVFPGGYYPITYKSELDIVQVRSKMDTIRKAMEKGEKPYMRDFFYADDMTRHNHTENRAENVADKFLNLDMSTIGFGFDKLLHDLNFREPISQVLRLVGDKDVQKTIISVVGDRDFKALLGNVVDAAQSQEAENAALWNSSEAYDVVVRNVKNAAAVHFLVGSVNTIAIQPTNLAYSYSLMGTNGVKHSLEILAALSLDPTNFMSYIQKAADINPTIAAWSSNLDENVTNQLAEILPKKYTGDVHKFLSELNRGVNQKGFAALGLVDALSKSIVTLTAYKQYLSGDSKGVTMDDLQNMSQKEIQEGAVNYANQVARLTLTATQRTDRAGIQKNPKFAFATTFWNDARQTLLNSARLTREIKWKVKEGDKMGAVNATLVALLVMGMVKTYQDVIRGNPTPLFGDDEKEVNLKEVALYYGGAPVDMFLGNTVSVKDAYYFAKTREWNKSVSTLATQATTDIVKSGFVLYETLETMIMNQRFKKMSDSQIKQMGRALSYITGGIPLKLVADVLTALNSKPKNDLYIPPLAAELSEKMDEVSEMKDAGDIEIPEDVWQKMQEIESEVNPETELEPPPPDTAKVIKEVSSGGKWYAKSDKSDKAGLYMFSEATWNFIDEQAPELALTQDGRTSSSTSQQEEAMDWYLKHNNEALAREGIKGTLPNLYAAHILGGDNAVKILSATADTKIKTLVEAKVLEENEIKPSMKVKDFKTWADNKVASVQAIS